VPGFRLLLWLTESIRRMTRRYVNQLTHGDSVDDAFLVADKQLRANRQGNLYLHLELRDKTGTWLASSNRAIICTSKARPRSSRGRCRSSSRTST
jgi:hypothetical protein